MIITTTKHPFEYVTEADRLLPKEKQTTFRMKPLTFDEQAEAQDILGASGGKAVGSFHSFLLLTGILGWDNLKDEDGTTVPYMRDEDGQVRKDLLVRIDIAGQSELASAVWNSGEIDEADAKNSETQSQ